MDQNKLLTIIKENRLLQTEVQVDKFETALAEIAENHDASYLDQYHLILNDNCERPEVMFSLIHFLESFDIELQIRSFMNVVPQLMVTAPAWARIIHERILNDESACHIYQSLLHSINLETPHFIYHLLEESVMNKIGLKTEILPLK